MNKIISITLCFLYMHAAYTQESDTSEVTVTLSVMCLLVNDYDEAIDFYTQKLGFTIAKDAKYGENQRWVSLALESNPTFEVSLGLATSDEDKTIVGKQGGRYPFFVLVTSDFDKTYNEYKTNGIEFFSAPQKFPWGIGVTFMDLYGNTIYLKD